LLPLLASIALLVVAGPALAATKSDLHYGPNRQQVLDVYLPPGTPGWRPAVVLIHGGAWSKGDQKVDAGLARRLAREGWVVVATTYRKTLPSLPNAYEDVGMAVTWTRRHSRAYRIDTGRIAAWGESAGGHLALMLGTRGRVAAVVAWSSPTDLLSFKYVPTCLGLPDDLWPLVVGSVMGCSQDACPGACLDMSPIAHLSERSARTFLAYYEIDAVDRLEQGRPFVERARALGVEVAWRVWKGIGHGVNPERVDEAIAWLRGCFTGRATQSALARTARTGAWPGLGRNVARRPAA
jgi:acetyl esterase/lipase